jgi:hypothetical protein
LCTASNMVKRERRGEGGEEKRANGSRRLHGTATLLRGWTSDGRQTRNTGRCNYYEWYHDAYFVRKQQHRQEVGPTGSSTLRSDGTRFPFNTSYRTVSRIASSTVPLTVPLEAHPQSSPDADTARARDSLCLQCPSIRPVAHKHRLAVTTEFRPCTTTDIPIPPLVSLHSPCGWSAGWLLDVWQWRQRGIARGPRARGRDPEWTLVLVSCGPLPSPARMDEGQKAQRRQAQGCCWHRTRVSRVGENCL